MVVHITLIFMVMIFYQINYSGHQNKNLKRIVSKTCSSLISIVFAYTKIFLAPCYHRHLDFTARGFTCVSFKLNSHSFFIPTIKSRICSLVYDSFQMFQRCVLKILRFCIFDFVTANKVERAMLIQQ